MRESINVPVVWLELAKTYSARHFHIYQPQSRGFDDLTERELHQWIRKRLVFDRIWKAPTLRPQYRVLPSKISHFKLVPGGRWLLASSQSGSVCYYDLDSGELKGKPLIQFYKDVGGPHQPIWGLETYANQDTSGLHFDLAIRATGERLKSNACFLRGLCFHFTDDRGPTLIEWLHVWQVKINDGDSLTAKWQTSIPTSCNARLDRALAIGRDVVARTRIPVRSLAAVEIYWWKRCSTTDILRSHFLAPPDTVRE